MNHLTDDQLFQYLFDDVALDAEQTAHLALCAACNEKMQTLTALVRELAVAQLSVPQQKSLDNYYQLFDQVQTAPSFLTRSVQWIKAQLQWDSRQQPALQGVRGASSPTYRLLYSSDVADVELLVEARNGNRWIEGEIIPLADGELQFPALLQFSHQHNNQIVYEVESDQNGRFRVESLQPGNYSFSLLPSQGAQLQIDTLGLT